MMFLLGMFAGGLVVAVALCLLNAANDSYAGIERRRFPR